MIRNLTRSALTRLLAAAGLARVTRIERERTLAATARTTDRTRARREGAAAAAKVRELNDKLRAAKTRATAEHAEAGALVGLLRHYLVRLNRTETELTERAAAGRRLKLAQLAIGVKATRTRGVAPAAAERAAQFASTSHDYRVAAARWRTASDVPGDLRRTTIARLQWSVPADIPDHLSRRILEREELPLDDFAAVREFAVGGVMLDIGASIGITSIPRVVLGDFDRAYAAEPHSDRYLCLVGNTLDNHCAGQLLPDRAAIAGTERTVALHSARNAVEHVPCKTLDAWVQHQGIPLDDIRLVRIAAQPWNLDILHGARHLLKRPRIVWQIEMEAELVRAACANVEEDLCAPIAAHFTYVKELGRYWRGQWRAASELSAVLATLATEGRAANVLLFKLPGGSTRS